MKTGLFSSAELEALEKDERPRRLRNLHCKEPGCKDPVHAKGYCAHHYSQMWRKGKTYEPAPSMNPDVRIHIRVDDGTRKALAALSKLWKCTASEAVRRAILEVKPFVRTK